MKKSIIEFQGAAQTGCFVRSCLRKPALAGPFHICAKMRISRREAGYWHHLGKATAYWQGKFTELPYAQPEDAPYPIKRIKSIIKECTQADLIELEKQKKRSIRFPTAARMPIMRFRSKNARCCSAVFIGEGEAAAVM